MFPTNFASVTAEITMYSRHVTKMDIYLFLISSNYKLVATEKSWPQRRTVFQWESDDLIILTHNFQHNKNNAMFQRDLSRVSCETS